MLELSQLFALLAEPVRLQIIGQLAGGERCVCKLYEALNLPQSTVSRHLGLLRLNKVVVARRKGTWMHYRLAPELWPESWRSLLEIVALEAASRQANETASQTNNPLSECR